MIFPFARPINLPAEPRLGDLSRPAAIAHLCRIESGVTDGNCVLGVTVVALECMLHGNIFASTFVLPAAEFRQQYVRWCYRNWHSTPEYCNMKINEIIYLNHHVGATSAQQALEDWGSTPEEQLAMFKQLGPTLLLGEGDLTLISSMLHSITRLRLQFRIWRFQDGFHVHAASCPDNESLAAIGVWEAVVVDVEHAGSLDSRVAHYKLLVSASLFGLCRIMRNPSTSFASSTSSTTSTALAEPTDLNSDVLPCEAKERNERAAEKRACGKRIRP